MGYLLNKYKTQLHEMWSKYFFIYFDLQHYNTMYKVTGKQDFPVKS